jgi:hypothetical protein
MVEREEGKEAARGGEAVGSHDYKAILTVSRDGRPDILSE